MIRNWYLNFWACYLCLSWIYNLHGFMWTWSYTPELATGEMFETFFLWHFWLVSCQIPKSNLQESRKMSIDQMRRKTIGSKDGVELKEIIWSTPLLPLLSFLRTFLLVLLHIVNLIYLLFSFFCFFVVYFLIYLIIYLYSFSDTRLFQIQLRYSHSDPMPPRCSFLFS